MTDETTDTEETEETKDLDYLMLHPDEFPDDPSNVEGVESDAALVTDDTVIPTVDLRPQPEETPATEPEPEPKVEPEALKPADPVEEKLPVETKDGKATIPFAVLAGERKKAKEAEARAVQAEEALEAERARQAEAPPETPPEVVPDEDEPDWENLASEYPEDVIKVMKSSWQTAQSAKADAKAAREDAARYRVSEETQVRDDSQDAIDRNATLVAWQSNNEAAWKQAGEMDELLKGQEEWATKTLDERFVKVVEMVNAMNPEASITPPADTTEQTDAKAKAALAAAGSTAPTSLSDVPGGSPPPQNEQEAVENTTSTQLAAKMEDMDPDKLEEYLNRLDV